ncbi:acyl-CoA carboxylase epsilon subunit [Solwaraspora sp. WMMB335]|uniref:acyl-CoA carboxylase epsilon subunit n=1 Tax=Solwaraspora sp. WMMB335 TaxID=3404118 RepID=UPI003B964E36
MTEGCADGGMVDADRDWRITSGVPNAEELAALVGAVLIRIRPVSDTEDGSRGDSRWARAARPTTRPLPPPGPGAWRSTALPG